MHSGLSTFQRHCSLFIHLSIYFSSFSNSFHYNAKSIFIQRHSNCSKSLYHHQLQWNSSNIHIVLHKSVKLTKSFNANNDTIQNYRRKSKHLFAFSDTRIVFGRNFKSNQKRSPLAQVVWFSSLSRTSWVGIGRFVAFCSGQESLGSSLAANHRHLPWMGSSWKDFARKNRKWFLCMEAPLFFVAMNSSDSQKRAGWPNADDCWQRETRSYQLLTNIFQTFWNVLGNLVLVCFVTFAWNKQLSKPQNSCQIKV